MLLNIIAGYDKKDTTSVDSDKKDYTACLKGDVKGLKIGVPKEFYAEGINEEVKEKLEEAIDRYKKLGAEIEEFSLDIAKYSLASYYIIACAEASSNLGRFDGIRYTYRTGEFKNLKNYIKNQEVKDLDQRLKEESFLEHMYYHQDIMMHITKRHNKYVHWL